MATIPPVLEEWRARNPKSGSAYAEAARLMIDGVTQDVRSEAPYPVTIVGSSGNRVETLDGDQLVCYVMGHGSLLLGHVHPEVVRAVQAQAARAFHYGGSHPAETEWAEMIVRLIPTAEKVRFTSSGTEATMLACRLARAATGRSRIVKFNGHFGGWHDALLKGFMVPFDRRFAGVTDEVFGTTTAIDPVPSDLDRLLSVGDVAAVIIEPAGGYSGAVPVSREFIEHAREACTRTGTVLIFDEVVTGFRWAPGGAQQLLGIYPDITTLGKIMAGGLPGGAVAGRQEHMEVLSAARGQSKVIHTGTHNGHPLAAAAGIATLRLLEDGGPQKTADQTCRAVVDGFNDVLRAAGVPGLCYGASSHFCIIVGVPELAGVTDATKLDSVTLRRGTPPDVLNPLNCAMMLNGVHLFHGHGFVSSAHNPASTEATVDAFAASIGRLQQEGVL